MATTKKPPVHHRDIVVVCAWCPELHILKLDREMTDTIEVLQHGSRVVIKRNGMSLGISHGICVACEAAQHKRDGNAARA